ncbi:MAG: DUF2142 domain-containing protein [Clostridia bacterium]|nr:DUF2142 domain-containing protein [Clostridia bacterium]
MGKFFKILNKNKWAIIFVAFLLCISFTLAVIQPNNVGPDEHMKMDICRYIVENGKLPHGGEEAIRDKLWGNSYGFTPILSYMIGSIFIMIAKNFTSDIHIYYVCARLVSVICYAFMGVFVIKIGRKLFENKLYRSIFVLLVTILPQVIFLGSYINNDSIALLSISMIIYAWIIAKEKKFSIKSCIFLGISIGICTLSYYNAYGYILTSIMFFIAYSIINKIGIKEFFKKGIIISVVTLAICGWWFVRNGIIYNGDILGMKTCDEYGEMYAIDDLKPSKIQTPQREGQNIISMLTHGWLQSTAKSFIAVFGAMDVVVPVYIYFIYLGIFAFGFIGYISKYYKLKYYKELKEDKVNLVMEIIFAINMVIPFLLSVYYSYTSDYQAQGRYIMPMLIPLMYFVTKGVERILDKIIKNETLKKVIQTIIMIILFVIAILCGVIIVTTYNK